MALTDEEKKRIKEEEIYRAKIRGEVSGLKKVNWKIYFTSSLVVWAIAVLLIVWYYLLPQASQQQTTGVYPINSKVFISGRNESGDLVKETIELFDRPCDVSGNPIVISMIKNGTQVKVIERRIWYYVTVIDEREGNKSGWVADTSVRPHDI